MARAKYTINEDDYLTAYLFLEKKVKDRHRFDGVKPDENETKHIVFLTEEFQEITLYYNPENETRLNTWCEKWLSSADWTRLKITIRAKRKRIKDKMNACSSVSINLSREAHSILSICAKREGATLSQVIEKYVPLIPFNE